MNKDKNKKILPTNHTNDTNKTKPLHTARKQKRDQIKDHDRHEIHELTREKIKDNLKNVRHGFRSAAEPQPKKTELYHRGAQG